MNRGNSHFTVRRAAPGTQSKPQTPATRSQSQQRSPNRSYLPHSKMIEPKSRDEVGSLLHSHSFTAVHPALVIVNESRKDF